MQEHLFTLAISALLTLGNVGTAAAESAAADFPNPASATLESGTFVNIENLRNVAPGLNKEQLYALLGPPHFHEGIFRVREWNYLFNFRRDGTTLTCQYQVKFDKQMRVDGTYWKAADCAALAQAREQSAGTASPAN